MQAWLENKDPGLSAASRSRFSSSKSAGEVARIAASCMMVEASDEGTPMECCNNYKHQEWRDENNHPQTKT